MPSKKKKYNARFPAGRIKKIMQTDEEVGKVAQAVPVIISRTLELFVQSLLTKSIQITQSRNAKTLTPSHMKQCILSEHRFDFLKDLVKNIPDASTQEDNENNANDAAVDFTAYRSPEQEPKQNASTERNSTEVRASPCSAQPEIVANFYTEQASSSGRTPVIQYSPKISSIEPSSVQTSSTPPKLHIDLSNISSPQLVPAEKTKPSSTITSGSATTSSSDNIPPLVPISNTFYPQNNSDNLLIDEDYDN